MKVILERLGYKYPIEPIDCRHSFGEFDPGMMWDNNTHVMFVFEFDRPDESVHPMFQIAQNLEIGWFILPFESDNSELVTIISLDGKVCRKVRRNQHRGVYGDFRIDTMSPRKPEKVKQVRAGEGFQFDEHTYMVVAVQPAKTGTVCTLRLKDGVVVEFDDDALVTPCEIILDFSYTVGGIGQ